MLARSKTKLIVFNGKKPENVTDAVHGRKIGTLVVSR
jgi:isopentenyl phosphate kinase